MKLVVDVGDGKTIEIPLKGHLALAALFHKVSPEKRARRRLTVAEESQDQVPE
jgi:hypothetical protein